MMNMNKDADFLKMMIKHHDMALDMSERYLRESSPMTRQARVADLARAIINAQTEEIETMRSWLRQMKM